MNVCHSLFETFNYFPKSGENCGEHKLPSCSFKNVALGEKATNVSCPGVTAYCKLQYLTKVLVSVHLKKLKKLGIHQYQFLSFYFKLLYEDGLWYQKEDNMIRFNPHFWSTTIYIWFVWYVGVFLLLKYNILGLSSFCISRRNIG